MLGMLVSSLPRNCSRRAWRCLWDLGCGTKVQSAAFRGRYILVSSRGTKRHEPDQQLGGVRDRGQWSAATRNVPAPILRTAASISVEPVTSSLPALAG